MLLHGTARINDQGHLEIGGCDTVALAKQYATPLYIMDEALIRQNMRRLWDAFAKTELSFQIAYASKAFSTLAMCRIVEEEGYSLDVVSAGELYTAIEAGFPSERIYFHGNNKSPFELDFAIDAGIGHFVVDNFVELTQLNALAKEKESSVSVVLRVSPGVEAHTHAYIQTGQEDSKFGFDLVSGQAEQAAQEVEESSHLIMKGFHCHIGSQIFETKAFVIAIRKMAEFVENCRARFGIETRVLNIGGGFGIRYEESDQPQSLEHFAEVISQTVRTSFQDRGDIPEIWIEPGRVLVGEAGTTLYTIGTMKEIPGIRKYVAVDGGMTDNPRPALYQAKYEALLANRAHEEAMEIVSIAGKCCESGDMLIWDIELPEVQTGDLLAVASTGAYNYSMASNYNRLPRPAVVFVQNGEADLVVERESLSDLIRKDRIPQRLRRKVAQEIR